MIAMKATVIATMILASLLLLAVPVAAEVGAGDVVQADVAPLVKPPDEPPTYEGDWGPGTGSDLIPYKWLAPNDNYQCGDVQVPPGSYRVSLKVDPPVPGSYSIMDDEGNVVGTLTYTLGYDEISKMYVLDWAVRGGTFTGDIAVKGGPGSFVYGYTGFKGDTALYPPKNPGENWPTISHFVFCGYFTPCCEEPVYCGLTPGYWKNHPGAWPADYDPNDLVKDIFTSSTYRDATLMDALNFGGGPGTGGAERILLRAAVAAVLNEATFGDCYQAPSICSIVVQVNEAIGSDDRATMIALAEKLDEWNNAGESS